MFGSRVTLSLVEEAMANLAPLALAQSRIGRVAPSAIKVNDKCYHVRFTLSIAKILFKKLKIQSIAW